jgi:hypothetical protein
MSFIGLFLNPSSKCSGAILFRVDSTAHLHTCRLLLFSYAVKRSARSLQLEMLGKWDDQSKRRFIADLRESGAFINIPVRRVIDRGLAFQKSRD